MRRGDLDLTRGNTEKRLAVNNEPGHERHATSLRFRLRRYQAPGVTAFPERSQLDWRMRPGSISRPAATRVDT